MFPRMLDCTNDKSYTQRPHLKADEIYSIYYRDRRAMDVGMWNGRHAWFRFVSLSLMFD